MTLVERLAENIRACFTGLWITSQEQDDALLEIAQLCRGQEWQQATWDIDRGFLMSGGDAAETRSSTTDPLAAIRAAAALGTAENPTLIVFKNFHRFLASRASAGIAHQIAAGKQRRVFYLVLAPIVQIPLELEKLFVVLEHELPAEQLFDIARGIATETGELPEGSDLEDSLRSRLRPDPLRGGRSLSLALFRHQREFDHRRSGT